MNLLKRVVSSILLFIAVFLVIISLSLIDLQNSKDSNDKETEILAYTSETVVDTVNPEWNEFGNPVDITKEAINEKGLCFNNQS